MFCAELGCTLLEYRLAQPELSHAHLEIGLGLGLG